MPCTGFKNMIICSRHKIKASRCYKCGSLATKLCDYGKSASSTCDNPMCGNCANDIGDDTHVCDKHFNDVAIRKAQKNRSQLKQLESEDE